MKTFVNLLMVAVVLFAYCTAPDNRNENTNETASETPAGDNSRTSLDWSGVYTGTLPCADCEGIETMVRLNKDLTYVLQRKYIGKADTLASWSGIFVWDAAGGKIEMDNMESAPAKYLVGENKLIHLDMNGDQISGDLAEKYTLKKVDTELTEKYWKLIELSGKPVPPPAENAREAHMVIRMDGNKVNGNSGCNNFFGTYTLGEGNRITFSQIGATKMACMNGMEVETEFFKALETADNYAQHGDSLSLNKAKMAPLAKFVAVYLR